MPDINIQQLKEFFEFRSDLQDERIKDITDKVEHSGRLIDNILTKVNTMWKVFGFVGLALLGGVGKSLGIF